jgi:hypothetical protein
VLAGAADPKKVHEGEDSNQLSRLKIDGPAWTYGPLFRAP